MTAGAPFSVTVAPQPGEFLPGLLLRGDEQNGLPPGTTTSMVRRHDSGTRQYGRAPLFVLATTLDLEEVATLHDVRVDAIVATTYRKELQRLFGADVPALRLGVAGGLRVCPACVRDRRLIRRETILPLVHGCAEHGIWLRHHCVCGAPVEAFGPAQPLACTACGLPREAASAPCSASPSVGSSPSPAPPVDGAGTSCRASRWAPATGSASAGSSTPTR